MDLDLLQDVLAEREPHPPGSLLHNSSPGRQLTDDPHQVNDSNDHNTQAGPFAYSSAQNQSGAVISKIEDIFEAMADCILGERKELVIQLKSRSRPATKELNSVSGVLESLQDTQFRNITFPSKSPQEAWKFTALFRILELSHEALVNGIVTTKRDMYYRDPELFLKQAVVDRFVDDIAYTFGVERHALNVVAAAKGLVAGAFCVKRKDGSTADFSMELEGLLVPDTKNIEGIKLQEIRWILVIEKEATFRTLATSQYWKESRAGKGIIITAKGYPDIQTRMFLRMLSTQKPNIPIFALVDFDPDGIGIMSTYKHGSMALAHESANLAVPSIRWLGIRSNDVPFSGPGLLKLTPRDRRIATRMLENELFQEGGQEAEWRRELQTMLFLNVKAEIQILGNGEALTTWLDTKLQLG